LKYAWISHDVDVVWQCIAARRTHLRKCTFAELCVMLW